MPLPAPDSVRIDTTTLVSAFIRPSSTLLPAGDSVLLTVYVVTAGGDTMPSVKTVAWSSNSPAWVVHPATAATAWAVNVTAGASGGGGQTLRLAFR